MNARPAFHTWGPSVYQSEDAQGYTQVPNSVLNALCPWLVALMKSFQHGTFSDITRAEFIKLLPEEFKNITKRTVTNWWKKYRALGFITRERDKEKPYLWTMTWTMPWLWKEPEKKAASAASASRTADDGSPVTRQDLSPGVRQAFNLMVEWTKLGWKLVVNENDEIVPKKVRENAQLPSDHLVIMTRNYKDDIREAITKHRPDRE